MTDFLTDFDMDASALNHFLDDVDEVSLSSGDNTEADFLDYAPVNYFNANHMNGGNIVSPDETRPSSPSASYGEDEEVTEAERQRMLATSLANSTLSEEEKERIRREKKREADRKCRKRKKEKVNEMEMTVKKLKDDRKSLMLRVQQLEAAASEGSVPVTPPSAPFSAPPSNSSAEAQELARSVANLFNLSVVECAAFVRDHATPSVALISPSLDTTGRDSLVKLYIGLKAQFPNSTLTVQSVSDEGSGKFDVSFVINGMLANGRPLSLPGHFFVNTVSNKVAKVVGMWNETSVLAQQFGMELSEWKKKADGASFFEDFWL